MWDLLIFLLILGADIAFAKTKHWRLIVGLFVVYLICCVMLGVFIAIAHSV